MDPSRSHRLVHVINNCEGPGQYNTNSTISFPMFDYMLIKLSTNKNYPWGVTPLLLAVYRCTAP